MDNRKLRQSAADDFMKSLEHLDELLGDTAEALVLDDEPQGSDASRTDELPLLYPQTLSSPKNAQNNAHQPRR